MNCWSWNSSRTFFFPFWREIQKYKKRYTYKVMLSGREAARNPKIKQVSSHNFDHLLCCLKDDSKLVAKKKMFKTNILKFFLEGASISNFYCATNQNNSCKYVSYDSRLLKPKKFFTWAPPIPLRPFVGVWIFSGITQCLVKQLLDSFFA